MRFVKNLEISTIARNEFKDITQELQSIVMEAKVMTGTLIAFVPHTTAGITVNENADLDVKTDMIKFLDTAIPWNNHYRHFEGNAAAHIKASIMGSSVTLFIEGGNLLLGTWQGVFFAEFDGPRKRQLHVKVVSD